MTGERTYTHGAQQARAVIGRDAPVIGNHRRHTGRDPAAYRLPDPQHLLVENWSGESAERLN